MMGLGALITRVLHGRRCIMLEFPAPIMDFRTRSISEPGFTMCSILTFPFASFVILGVSLGASALEAAELSMSFDAMALTCRCDDGLEPGCCENACSTAAAQKPVNRK